MTELSNFIWYNVSLVGKKKVYLLAIFCGCACILDVRFQIDFENVFRRNAIKVEFLFRLIILFQRAAVDFGKLIIRTTICSHSRANKTLARSSSLCLFDYLHINLIVIEFVHITKICLLVILISDEHE